ncbi:unnamed protein product [Chrysoparadoxa australica]
MYLRFLALSLLAFSSHAMRVLVIGGSGRVGGSTVRALHRHDAKNCQILVGGREETNFLKSKARWEQLDPERDYSNVSFIQLELSDPASLLAAMEGCDVCCHTAGPFQMKQKAEVLEAAIEARVPYVDVCDDAVVAANAKLLSPKAQELGVPAVISTGIWPGVDQLMALEAKEALPEGEPLESIEFAAFTAGTGGAGPTILSATFLILAERALTYRNGQELRLTPASDMKMVDFGGKVGPRQVFRMNLIEAYTARQTQGVANIDTFFGTAPTVYNYLLKFMSMLPKAILGNTELMQKFALFSMPFVRVTDMLVGATNSMRVQATGRDGSQAILTYGHDSLEECVGIATAAFCLAALRGDVAPGVFFPEEAFTGGEQRKALLKDATQGSFLYELETRSA